MRHATTVLPRPPRGPRAALVVGAALAAPMAAVGAAHAVGGLRAGEPPSPSPAPVPDAAVAAGPSDADVAAAEAFLGAGYAYCDAVALADTRGVDPWDAKVALGARILAGERVDAPSGCADDATAGADPALAAFWDHGYAYCDAVAIADAMGTDPYEAKLAVGAALLAGDPAPAPATGCAG